MNISLFALRQLAIATALSSCCAFAIAATPSPTPATAVIGQKSIAKSYSGKGKHRPHKMSKATLSVYQPLGASAGSKHCPNLPGASATSLKPAANDNCAAFAQQLRPDAVAPQEPSRYGELFPAVKLPVGRVPATRNLASQTDNEEQDGVQPPAADGSRTDDGVVLARKAIQQGPLKLRLHQSALQASVEIPLGAK